MPHVSSHRATSIWHTGGRKGGGGEADGSNHGVLHCEQLWLRFGVLRSGILAKCVQKERQKEEK
eukprot:scaffold98373_cov26-Tisochrysis_lutea.AAC.5